jgi:CheY-like chemotaxis protein
MMDALSRPRDARDDRLGPRVLVVEDDPNTRWVLCALMKRSGYDCRAAADGEEALAMDGPFAPQVILMDAMMPGTDGIEATRRLKRDDRTRMIPVLILTGNLTPGNLSAAREAGCDDLVPKPVALPDLLQRLRKYLGT